MLALYIIAGIVLLGILMLSVPVDLKLDIDTTREKRSVFRIAWLWGIAGKDVKGREKEKPKKPEEKPAKKKKSRLRPFIALLQADGVVKGIIKLLRRIIKSFKIRELDAYIRFGLDDPADTGILYSLYWLTFTGVVFPRGMNVKIEPVFEEMVLVLILTGNTRIYPAQILGYLVLFLFSPAGFRLIKVMVGSRWR